MAIVALDEAVNPVAGENSPLSASRFKLPPDVRGSAFQEDQ